MTGQPAGTALPRRVAVVGGGPAGLMAAERLADGGCTVDLFDAMPSVGRKFLLAGKGGLNITHSEPAERFGDRFGAAGDWLAPMLAGFGPAELRAWVHGLGIDTFVGTSGRVFPEHMKAAPLLRAWLHRLRAQGIRFHMRARWSGFAPAPTGEVALCFDARSGDEPLRHEAGVDGHPRSFDAVVLALGGASWPQLGSDGRWWPVLQDQGVALAPLVPANCGFDAGWSEHFATRFAGAAVKSVAAGVQPDAAPRQGEFVVTATGVEGSLVYTLAPELRDRIAREGMAFLFLDLLPDRSLARVSDELSRPRGGRSMSNHLRVRLGLTGVKAALLRECAAPTVFDDPAQLAGAVKALPVRLFAARPIAEAISTAGGVTREATDSHLMLRGLPGVFCAGEMLDWEAPTGGYLLTASLASGRAAAAGVLGWLQAQGPAAQGSAA
jgi:uncharacterized flavoprotein (TIGR03862 family)